MSHRTKTLRTKFCALLAMLLVISGILLPIAAPPVFAQGVPMSLTVSGPSYVTPDNDITYTLTIKNLTNQEITDIAVFSELSANVTHISGGTFIPADSGVEFYVDSLAAKATVNLTLVVNVDSEISIGDFIEVSANQIFSYKVDGQSGEFTIFADYGARTTVEEPGTLKAIYKNNSGHSFDVTVDGFQFENYGSDSPHDASDDLGVDDMFYMFGPEACHSGTTADTCVLTGPAQEWLEATVEDMGLGHCYGMAAASLHIFDRLSFKGLVSPSDIQAGASQTNDLLFPDQTIENYITGMMAFQYVDDYYDFEFVGSPVATVNKLITDFKKADAIPYTVAIFKLPDFAAGHAITAYGVEEVNADESRILVYDNNFPNQRQYITVDMAANTWTYTTAAIPGEAPDVYSGTANSKNLQLHDNRGQDHVSGEYFQCPFCSQDVTGARVQDGDLELLTGTLNIQYSGEGSILIVNNEGQRVGTDPVTHNFVDEIPNTHIIPSRGGLGKQAPPRIQVPFSETDDTFYKVIVHGKSTISVTSGTLTMFGAGFALGVNDIALDPGEEFEFTVSPDGDHISFDASEAITAPEIFIAHDPIHPGNPSVTFDIEGITLLAGEKVSLDLDPELERIHFNHSGPEEEDFVIDMKLIWPDGDVQDYNQTIQLPAGDASAFVDFGAWDGLLHPAIYFDGMLQNPSINHRLKLVSTRGLYDATPQANAPAGVYHIDATFMNVTEVQMADLYFTVADIAEGNVLLNADGSPVGTGAKLTLPAAALGEDGLLHVNEAVTVRFSIGLANDELSTLTLDANGTPHDWTHEAPPLAGQAQNSSFEMTVRADNPSYLPFVIN